MSRTQNASRATASFMEIIVNRDALLAELTFAQSIAEAKTTIAILSHVLLEASENQMLTITATDLDRAVVTTVQAKVKNPGSVAIPARKFFDYVKLLPGGEITMKELDNSWISLHSGRSKTKMVAMSRSNYPKVETIGNRKSVKLPVLALKLLTSQTAFAASTEESRYSLNGALFGMEPGKLFMVATDSHRLALSEKFENVDGITTKSTVLISNRALSDLQKLFSTTEEETIRFAQDDSGLYFELGRRKYSSRRIAGEFPNYEAVIPRDNNRVVIVGAADVDKSLRRVATFADDKSSTVRVALEESTLKFSARSTETGESEDTIEIRYNKEPMAIGFNSAYLLDFIKVIGGEGEFKMMLKNANSPGVFLPEGEGQETSFKCVIMPCRI
jgi:DNA polymerase III subunit beta